MKNSSKLERFDETLVSFENELQKLKGTSDAYQRLEGLVKSYKSISKQLEDNSKSLEELVFQYVKKHQEVEAKLQQIEEANSNNYERLRKENKEQYFDLEKTLKIKLEEHKSEIKRLIEHERKKIKEIVEEKLEKETEKILASQTQLRNTFLIIGVTTLVLAMLILVKLFL